MHVSAMDDICDVRALRLRINWKQERMAEFLGVDRSTVSHLENGRKPSGAILRLLSMLSDAADTDSVEELYALATSIRPVREAAE